ncbi:DUF4349 domain-containing protein [Planctomycetaceae bacterium SH139]
MRVFPNMNGFVANLNQYGASGQQAQASWTLRVSAGNFSPMLAWIESNAAVITKIIDSLDVTEEYINVESRIANKRKAEQRLLKLLENRSAKLEDVLVVEKELDRIRESIERMEGRLRFLAERTSLSTFNSPPLLGPTTNPWLKPDSGRESGKPGQTRSTI